MKIELTLAAALLGAPVFAQQPIPDIPFDTVPDFFQYPADVNLGELSGVAVSPKTGHIFMISRGGISGPLFGAIATELLEFDAGGRFVRNIGKGVYGFGYAHGVRVDKDDNIWVVDKGTNVIMRFNQTGHVTMVLGRKEEPSEEHEYPDRTKASTHVDGYYQQPTDIAWDSQGNIFISDGYVNSRVAKLDKNGNWLKTWGARGTGPGEFNTPHNIGIDRNNNVYVADRANARIQVFDTEGKFLRQIKFTPQIPAGFKNVLGNTPATPPVTGTMAPGAPWTICITQGPTQYLYTSDASPGHVYKLTLDGKVIGKLGIAGRADGQFNWLHGLACPAENELYVADLNNWRVQKLLLHPEKMVGSGSR